LSLGGLSLREHVKLASYEKLGVHWCYLGIIAFDVAMSLSVQKISGQRETGREMEISSNNLNLFICIFMS